MRKSAIFLILLFTFAAINVNAESFKDNLHWAGLANIFFFAADNGDESDPMAIVPSLGVSAAWQFTNILRLELSEDIYIANYEFNSSLGYPAASSIENNYVLVIGFVTGIQITGVFPIKDNGTQIRAYAGPAMDFRIVTVAAGLNHPSDSQAQAQANAVSEYFWNEARWFMPTVGFGMDFPLTEKILLGFDIRAWVPIYKLWSSIETPAIEGWRFGIGMRITPRKKKGTAAAQQTTDDPQAAAPSAAPLPAQD